jgi:hypothetical protein
MTVKTLAVFLFDDLSEALACRNRGQTDQTGIVDRGFPMLDRFAIDRIANHFDECGHRWIFRDEANISPFVTGSDQHEFELALPDNAAAKPGDHRSPFTVVGGIGVGASRMPAVRIARLCIEPDEVEQCGSDRRGYWREIRRMLAWLDRGSRSLHLRPLPSPAKCFQWVPRRASVFLSSTSLQRRGALLAATL